MWKNYLKIALRNLRRNKSYALLNLSGLAVGIGVCLLIGLYIRYELSYDDYHENANRIYRVVLEEASSDVHDEQALMPELLAPALKQHIPEVEEAVRLEKAYHPRLVRAGGHAFYEDRFFHADSSFFDVFTFPFLRGDPRTALSEPGSVVLTQSAAEKYFPGSNPVGERLTYYGDDYRITGVMEDVPANSHFHFNFLGRLEATADRWFMYSSYTYALLHPQASPGRVDDKLDRFVEDVINPQMEMGEMASMRIQPLSRIHLHSNMASEIEPNSDVRYVYIFGAAALLILLIACINYVNLATARSMRRAKEVGVRKTLGADCRELIRQFLGESVLVSLGALLLGLLLLRVTLPLLNQIAGTAITLDAATIQLVTVGGLAAALLVGIVAGSYPAFYLSRFRPTDVLKEALGGPSGSRMRKGLVVFQFTGTVALLIATLVISGQLDYLRDKRLGFDKERVVMISDWDRALSDSYESFKQELQRSSRIQYVSAGHSPLRDGGYTVHLAREDGEPTRIRIVSVDYGYAETLSLDLNQGQTFSPDRHADSTTAFIANELVVQEMGWEKPLQEEFRFWQGSGPIIGVVENFHMRSLRDPLQPMLLALAPGHHPHILVRLRSGSISEGLDAIEQTWSRFTDRPLLYSFLDDELEALYQSEERIAHISGAFALTTILVACLGLYGLAAFMAERRTKEIGIRKVFGASMGNIIALLSRDFMWLVVIAFAIAAPVAYYAMNRWLENFAYRIELGPWIFISAGLLTVIIAVATVSYQALRVALMNPTDTLRYE